MSDYYRVYLLDDDGHVDGPAKIIKADSDAEAVERARKFVDGHAAEVWLGARCIARLKHTH